MDAPCCGLLRVSKRKALWRDETGQDINIRIALKFWKWMEGMGAQ